jgi:hypothetical protein
VHSAFKCTVGFVMNVAGEVVSSWKLEQRKHAILTFICPFIANISLKMQSFFDLFISINCCTCFRRFLRPSSVAENCIYRVRYCQTNIAACCYRGWDGTEFHLIHDSSRQQYWFDNTWHCIYSSLLLMMGGGAA